MRREGVWQSDIPPEGNTCPKLIFPQVSGEGSATQAVLRGNSSLHVSNNRTRDGHGCLGAANLTTICLHVKQWSMQDQWTQRKLLHLRSRRTPTSSRCACQTSSPSRSAPPPQRPLSRPQSQGRLPIQNHLGRKRNGNVSDAVVMSHNYLLEGHHPTQ